MTEFGADSMRRTSYPIPKDLGRWICFLSAVCFLFLYSLTFLTFLFLLSESIVSCGQSLALTSFSPFFLFCFVGFHSLFKSLILYRVDLFVSRTTNIKIFYFFHLRNIQCPLGGMIGLSISPSSRLWGIFGL